MRKYQSKNKQLADLPGIGRRLKIARKQAGFNQMEVGELLGKAPTTVSAWERGDKVSTDVLGKLSRLYKKDITWLLIGGEDMPPAQKIKELLENYPKQFTLDDLDEIAYKIYQLTLTAKGLKPE